jgi:glycosidase
MAVLLHVPSPEWRDQIIYFLMLDRFADGDPGNNDQGVDEYRPKDNGGWNGGDLKGVTGKLDYIQGLGATAIWTTPPVANQWWSKESGFGGYHGYWARDFTKIDEHYGTLQDYQTLSCSLHQRNMYHVMDIVVNHTGDFFEYDPKAMSADPTSGYRRVNPDSPTDAPTNFPFNLNDPRRAEDRDVAAYHWSKELLDYYDPEAELTQQLAKLDDINTRSPKVRAAFKEIFGNWIEQGGVDAFRVDTVKYVEPDFFEDFLHAPDGIMRRAAKTGRTDFFVFGEVKENAPAFTTLSEAKLQKYFGDPASPTFPSMINFPLQEEMIRVLAQGSPTSALTYRLDAFLRTHPDPTLATNFVDNHDVPRFLSQGSLDAFKQALALTFTLPGIPMIYQGNEQAFSETRQAMFKEGFGTDRDHFDTRSEMYAFIKQLSAVRQGNAALRRGDLRLLSDNPNVPGVFAFRRDYQGESIFLILNTADNAALLAGMPTGLASGTPLRSLFGAGAAPEVASDGTLTLELAPRAIMILASASGRPDKPVEAASRSSIPVDTPFPETPLSKPFTMKGRYNGPENQLKLVIDGDLGSATTITVARDGRWQARLEARDVGVQKHVAQIYAPISGAVSKSIPYITERTGSDWQVSIADPAFDDVGKGGGYALPTDPSFQGRQDILRADLRSGGDILEMELTMRTIGADWKPSNGFDHVAITTFFEFPEQQGLTRSEDVKADMPAGFDWSAMHSVFGWGSSLVLKPDRKIGQAPRVVVDTERKTIKPSFKASSLGLKSWRGVRLYITSFDREGEGGFRAISTQGGPMAYRGDPAGPRIMDDLMVAIPE